MCGLAGYYTPDRQFSPDDLLPMMQAVAHRGPDAGGSFSDDFAGLAHRRLSIIDLSEQANQPMFSHTGRYAIVYNGEVYNFQEISRELQLPLKTTSDTEVILEAFAKWGEHFVNRLNGMFAIAIYDKQEKLMYLFRDRIGIKPLYYFREGNNIAFASEIRALAACPAIRAKLSLNIRAINDFLHMGFIPEPHSVYENIFKFPAASMAKLGPDGITITEYWNIYDKITPGVMNDGLQAKEMLKEILFSAVEYRMISDVPFGVFLSGGIDSSLVAAIAQNLSPVPVKSYTIGFEENRFDESPYARKIAAALGTDHHEFILREKEAINLLDKSIELFDEPFGDSSAVPTMLVSQMARQSATMILTGDGGDELFMGYGAYKWARRLEQPWVKMFHPLVSLVLSKMDNRRKRASLLFNFEDMTNLRSHIFSQEQYCFSESEISEFLNTRYLTGISKYGNPRASARRLAPDELQSLFDFQVYLKDDLLVKVDRASMHYSLECRTPLLDYRLVEFIINLDPKLKARGKETKLLLKEVLFDLVPKQYFDRPKQGFSVPMKNWLHGELKEMVMDNLSESMIEKNKILNFEATEKLLKDFYLHKKDYLFNRVWLLLVLQKMIPRL